VARKDDIGSSATGSGVYAFSAQVQNGILTASMQDANPIWDICGEAIDLHGCLVL